MYWQIPQIASLLNLYNQGIADAFLEIGEIPVPDVEILYASFRPAGAPIICHIHRHALRKSARQVLRHDMPHGRFPMQGHPCALEISCHNKLYQP